VAAFAAVRALEMTRAELYLESGWVGCADAVRLGFGGNNSERSRLMGGLKKTAVAATAIVLLSGIASAQDAEEGAEVFKKCRSCHQVGDTAKNLVGPRLNGLFGRKSGTVEGFNYSEANKSSGIVWDEKTFADYIRDPKAAMPGNKMAFAGLKDDKDIADLTAFLKQYDAEGKKK